MSKRIQAEGLVAPAKSAVYLHGFASSPKSIKASYFARLFAQAGLPFFAPDLNGPDFPSITVSRMIADATVALNAAPAPVVLLGSSMGGYAAALAAAQSDRVGALVLFAPAFDLDALWHHRLSDEQLLKWRQTDRLDLEGGAVPGQPAYLRYAIFADAEKWRREKPKATVPTLIFHGELDEVVPVAGSRAFAHGQALVRLMVFANSGHGLNDRLEAMGDEVKGFLGL